MWKVYVCLGHAYKEGHRMDLHVCVCDCVCSRISLPFWQPVATITSAPCLAAGLEKQGLRFSTAACRSVSQCAWPHENLLSRLKHGAKDGVALTASPWAKAGVEFLSRPARASIYLWAARYSICTAGGWLRLPHLWHLSSHISHDCRPQQNKIKH